MSESINAEAIEATITVLDGRLPETGFVTSASSSIRVNLNYCGSEPAGEFWRFLGGGRASRRSPGRLFGRGCVAAR
jgi:hypothetical protein